MLFLASFFFVPFLTSTFFYRSRNAQNADLGPIAKSSTDYNGRPITDRRRPDKRRFFFFFIVNRMIYLVRLKRTVQIFNRYPRKKNGFESPWVSGLLANSICFLVDVM